MNKRLIFYYPKLFIRFLLSPLYFSRIFLNDLKAFFGIYSYSYKYIFIAGYPKSGTTWVENFISRIPGYNPRVLFGDADILRRHDLPVDTFSKIPYFGYSAIKTHINPSADNIQILKKEGINKLVVMYRDPRDIIVSNYYHVKSFNPWKITDPEYANYSSLDRDDALMHSTNLILDDFCDWVFGWKDIASSGTLDCLFVSYEDLRKNPLKSFDKILNFYDIPHNSELINSLMAKSNTRRFKGPSGFEPGAKSTHREGKSGSWADELSRCHIDFINKKIGNCLTKLGYK